MVLRRRPDVSVVQDEGEDDDEGEVLLRSCVERDDGDDETDVTEEFILHTLRYSSHQESCGKENCSPKGVPLRT